MAGDPDRAARHFSRPAGPDESRAIPPRSPVSPGGNTTWPRPSLAARIMVYGGVALGVAGVTAAAVSLIHGSRRSDDRRPAMPAPAAGGNPREPASSFALPPLPRSRRKKPPLHLGDITRSVDDASRFLSAALTGLRSVTDHAQGLYGRYRDLADTFQPATEPPPNREGAAGPRAPFRDASERRTHRL